MVNPAVKEQILSDLERLPGPKGTPGHDLRKFAGVLDPESTREMMEAIEEECERVDLNEW